MTGVEMTEEERRLRLYIYEFLLHSGRCPDVVEMAKYIERTPLEAQRVLERLESVHSAVVLSPGSPNLWLADPFAALPTAFPALANDHRWYGMCIWDALGILALAGVDGRAPTACPVSGEPLELRVRGGDLVASEVVVHFAVPASRWWENIGFT